MTDWTADRTAGRHITITAKRLLGPLWWVGFREHGNTKHLPCLSRRDPSAKVAVRLGRVLHDEPEPLSITLANPIWKAKHR